MPFHSTAVWLLLIAAVIFGVTLVAWLLGANPLVAGDLSGQANAAIQPWRWVLMLGRWTLWCGVWWQWAWIGNHLFRGGSERAEAQRKQWQAMRARMMGGIAIVEIVILFSFLTGG